MPPGSAAIECLFSTSKPPKRHGFPCKHACATLKPLATHFCNPNQAPLIWTSNLESSHTPCMRCANFGSPTRYVEAQGWRTTLLRGRCSATYAAPEQDTSLVFYSGQPLYVYSHPGVDRMGSLKEPSQSSVSTPYSIYFRMVIHIYHSPQMTYQQSPTHNQSSGSYEKDCPPRGCTLRSRAPEVWAALMDLVECYSHQD